MDRDPRAHEKVHTPSEPSLGSTAKRASIEHFEKAPLSSSVHSVVGVKHNAGGPSHRRIPFRWMAYRYDLMPIVVCLLPSDPPLIRQIVREAFAEFIGIAILIIFGNGVNCQVTLTENGAAGVCNLLFFMGVRSLDVDVLGRIGIQSTSAGQ